MKNYNKINNLTGWAAFAVSAFVYLRTIEPTGSFWDCGEFIAAAFKLQVGHPPGAPLFLMIARFFTLFAGGDVKLVPIMVNVMSALSSAFTILFLFWSVTHLARKMVKATDDQLTMPQLLMIMGAGMVGALSYTFSDSFWFFSIGVHLLNLLTIPALAYIYYFKRYKVTTPGLIYTGVMGVAILAFVQYGIVAGFVKIGAYFDLFFVNTVGLPIWSGFLFLLPLLLPQFISVSNTRLLKTSLC
ncbi:MAG: DUF2723 domain-containing protein [Bacteroidetes bacterium]|nr:DUF2723 domain-containing protein [Bacteroidota bacterium]